MLTQLNFNNSLTSFTGIVYQSVHFIAIHYECTGTQVVFESFIVAEVSTDIS
jgi:hypothetical protein